MDKKTKEVIRNGGWVDDEVRTPVKFEGSVYYNKNQKMSKEIKAKGQKKLQVFEPGEMMQNKVPIYDLPSKMFNCIVELVYAKEQLPNDQDLGAKIRQIIDAYQFTS